MKFRIQMRGMMLCFWVILAFPLARKAECAFPPAGAEGPDGALTVLAIGDIGEGGGSLRGNAMYVTAMWTGEHDAGRYQAVLFLGNNFQPTGLNIPAEEVEGRVKSMLGAFGVPFDALGRSNIHALPGNHDYYARNAVERSILFGLFNISELPVGLTDKGNLREEAIPSWTYRHGMPGEAFYPITPGAGDTVQFIFFDSALLLRTRPATWTPALDSLRKILLATKDRPGIRWRVLCTHHPLRTVGEHGGYTVWDDDEKAVGYLTACDKDTNALGWLRNWLDPEDLCAERYQEYADSVTSVIRQSGVRIQVSLAGHDHSLQLLFAPDDRNCELCPAVHIVSGAGSLTSRVKYPMPPREYTSAQLQPEKKGESLTGFAQLRFERDRMRVVFYNGKNGDLIDMGGGRTEFWIGVDGMLEETK